MITKTPEPPYYTVIFTSTRTDIDDGYTEMNALTDEMVEHYPGYFGNEYLRDENGFGIHVSYWKDMESIMEWKNDELHKTAKEFGIEKWYTEYKVRIAKVEYDSEI
ncbi:MAG: heme-degrading monooxygenase HmoA [Parvicellaceae bacterium]|jgi:heme-degrading monooxygenase HmoA